MKRQLTIIAGPENGKTIELEDGQTLVIGRGQASDTQLNDGRMSRVHCRISVDGDKTLLTDAGSSSGTFVGGQQITEQLLRAGDVFQIGDTKIRYQLDVPREASTITGDQAFGRPKPKAKVTPLQELVGQTLAHYRLDSVIAEGNSGMVFKAHDDEKDRPAAVKVLTPDPTRSEEQKERFVRAMKTMMPVQHPHIVKLYNAGKNGPYLWAAMEYVDGESMTDVIQRIGIEGMLDWRESYRVAVHIGRALHEAYEKKIIHRNLTPQNVLRRHSDKACLLGDLMLAKATEGTLARQVTQPGQLVGEVPYMAPERTRDDAPVDHRADLYGLGAMLYALLTGRAPFEGTSLPDLIRRVREAEPEKPKEFQLSINDMFQDTVMRLIEKRPEDRYEKPADLLVDLERIGKFNSLEADWSGWSG